MTVEVIYQTSFALDNIYKFKNENDRFNFYIEVFGTDIEDLNKIEWEFTKIKE